MFTLISQLLGHTLILASSIRLVLFLKDIASDEEAPSKYDLMKPRRRV